MSALTVIGVDPGPVPGFVVLDYPALDVGRDLYVDVVQCTKGCATDVFDALLPEHNGQVVVQIERFVVGSRASRSSTPSAGAATRDLIGELKAGWEAHLSGWGEGQSGALFLRSASEVKAWATDERLHAAGLYDLTAGMRHSRDAARHALFAAVKNGGIPDPLSRNAFKKARAR